MDALARTPHGDTIRCQVCDAPIAAEDDYLAASRDGVGACCATRSLWIDVPLGREMAWVRALGAACRPFGSLGHGTAWADDPMAPDAGAAQGRWNRIADACRADDLDALTAALSAWPEPRARAERDDDGRLAIVIPTSGTRITVAEAWIHVDFSRSGGSVRRADEIRAAARAASLRCRACDAEPAMPSLRCRACDAEPAMPGRGWR